MPLFRRNTEEKRTPLLVEWFGPGAGAVLTFLAEVAQIVIVAVALIFVVRYFLMKPFVVKGQSMEPNFYDSEYLIIDELTYRFRPPERGEVVVFHPTNTCGGELVASTTSREYYIKRVIGLPGEKIQIHAGVVTILNDEYPNGITLDETYTDEFTEGDHTWLVPEDHYFLLGDNREASLDSRMLCAQPLERIVGRAWIRGFPIDRFGVIALPTYNF